MGRKNKYNNMPPRIQVPVGGVCALCQCSRQIRKAAEPYCKGRKVSHALGFPASFPLLEIGMEFTGVNNITGETETFKVTSVLLLYPDRSSVERIK